MSDDPKISRRYRELPREEPARQLDDAILAAARRAVAPRRSRWYVPVAAAAIIVLAVAVTLHVERERPDDESAVAVAPPPGPAEEPRVMQAPPAAAPPPPPATKGFAPDPKPQAAPAPSHAPAAPPLADSAAPGREEYERRAAASELARLQAERELPRRGEAAASARADSAEEAKRSRLRSSAQESRESPEQWLLRIDDLKRQRRHEEAEKQLAEFRKRYPDYRIPEAILQKFEK